MEKTIAERMEEILEGAKELVRLIDEPVVTFKGDSLIDMLSKKKEI